MSIERGKRLHLVSKQAKSIWSESLESAISLTREHSGVTRYSLAILLSIFFIVLKILLDPLIGSLTPFIFIFPAVLISAWFGGIGPGAIAAILTVLGIAYFFLAPGQQLQMINLTNLLELIVYVIEATIVILVIHWRNKAYSDLKLRAAQQSIIAAISQYGIEGDLTAFMDDIVRTITNALNVDFCQISELLPDGKRLRVQSESGWKRGLVRKVVISAEIDSPSGYSLLSQKPLIIKNLLKDRRFKDTSFYVEQGIISVMSVVIPGAECLY